MEEAAPSVAGVELVLRREGQEIGRLPLADGIARVGGARDNDLVLDDPTVSRHHATVEVVPGGVRVRDLGSRNGIRYQGARVPEATIPLWGVLRLGNVELRVEAAARRKTVRLGDLESATPAMMLALEQLAASANAGVTVLLEGESGVGKERIAQALHAHSSRAAAPFEVVDCGALPRDLASAELFGHRKDAFTGAARERAGAFERANGGTVFLDEVGELPLELQPLLLRVIESREIRRMGDAAFRPVDVRIVAATNRDLDAEVAAGRFRTDLLYRLAVVRVRVPPLRERLEDLPRIVDALLTSLGPRARGLSLSPETLSALAQHRWPGNVRELRNAIERALALNPGQPVDAGDFGLPEDAAAPAGYRLAKKLAVEGFERDYVLHLLRAHDGNVSKAARAAGIDRVYLHRLMKRHGL